MRQVDPEALGSWIEWIDENEEVITLLRQRGCTGGEALLLIAINWLGTKLLDKLDKASGDDDTWRN